MRFAGDFLKAAVNILLGLPPAWNATERISLWWALVPLFLLLATFGALFIMAR
jgi:hypothetical protein